MTWNPTTPFRTRSPGKEHDHELESKLLLSRTFKGWNIAENTIATKNLTGGNPWEFGYAIGASRPLALKASAKRCNFCRENFIAGVEMYGGLGDRHSFGLHETSHYLAPVAAWNLPSDWTLRLSPGFGLNDNSHRFLLRWGVSREFSGFGEMIGRLFGGAQAMTRARRLRQSHACGGLRFCCVHGSFCCCAEG